MNTSEIDPRIDAYIGNVTARAIQVRQGETLNERALLNLFRAVIANNRAGGWRKLKS